MRLLLHKGDLCFFFFFQERVLERTGWFDGCTSGELPNLGQTAAFLWEASGKQAGRKTYKPEFFLK